MGFTRRGVFDYCMLEEHGAGDVFPNVLLKLYYSSMFLSFGSP